MTGRNRRTARVVFLVGPTAVGKTSLSVTLAKALNAEIVSCDSMQVYRGMNIISQAPPAAARKAVRHHLIGRIGVDREFSAAEFRGRAMRAVRRILSRGKGALFVGGSGLYVKALTDGLFPAPRADRRFRARMELFARSRGNAALHRRLAGIDPASAARIHPHDTRRIIRALELYHLTGETMTALKAKTKGLRDEMAVVVIGLARPREELYRRIDARVDAMMREGLVGEVQRLRKKRMGKTAAAALGLREIGGYLNGASGLEEAVTLLKMNTRRFARRQLAWFRADKAIRWFDVSRMGDARLAAAIRRTLR